MDEPFSGLDSRLKDSVRAETLAILRESRATAIVVTHDAEEAMRMGDRIALLKDGRLVQAGRAEDLYLAPGEPFRRRVLLRAERLRGTLFAMAWSTRSWAPIDANALPDGVQAKIAVRTTGFDVSESGGQHRGAHHLAALSRRGRTAGAGHTRRRNAGARTRTLRGAVIKSARHLVVFTSFRRTSV